MKAVYITGGTTGIGSELAKYYLAQGWKVGVCGRDPEKFQMNFPYASENLYFYEVDVANKEALQKSIKDFSSPIGLDLLIANAGIGYKSKTKLPDFDYSYKMVEINFLGVMYAFEAALEVMIPRGKGHLVGISSQAAFNGLPGVSAYSATKAAVLKYCESLHIDLKKFGVDVTAICPGFVETPLTNGNHHPMPFLVPAPRAAKLIAQAIEKKKMVFSFPFIFSSVVRFLSILPRTWYRSLMTRKTFNYSKES